MSALFLSAFAWTIPLAALTFPLEVRWSAALPSPPAHAPAFDAERVYVPLRNNQLVALKIADGSTAWSVECPTTAPPAAGDGLVYTGGDGLIEARANTDGRAQWRRPVQGRVVSLFWDTGWLLASTESGPLYAIRASDGHVLWERDFGAPLGGLPAPAGDRVYLSLKDGRLVAASLATGADIWTRKLAEPAAAMLPVADRVYVSGRDNQFHSLKAADGSTAWDWATGADVIGVPVLDDRRVYFIALDNVLRGHDRNNGTMKWKRVLPMRPVTGPVLAGDLLLVSGIAAEVHAFNRHSGQPVGNFVVKGVENEEMLLVSPPHLTAADSLILVTKGGQVRSLANPPPAPEAPVVPPAPAEAAPPSPDAAPAPASSAPQ